MCHGGVKGCSAAVSLVSTSSQIVLKHNMIGIKSLSNFESESEGTVVILGRHARQRTGLCIPLEGCRVKVYQSYDTLQCHLHVGNHLLKLERETAYDKIKGKWTAACKSVAGSYVRGGLYLRPSSARCLWYTDSDAYESFTAKAGQE